MLRSLNGRGERQGRVRYYSEGVEGDNICYLCICVIRAGTPMYAKTCGKRNTNTRYFHKHCWERMFLA